MGFLNSFVHIVMYFYYMVAAMGPKYRKYLWWKKYMTWMQLIQFTIMLTYLVLLVIFDCKFSRSLTFFFVGNVVIFLYLFSRFYVQAYKSKKVSDDTLDQNQNILITDNNINKKKDWLFKYLYLPKRIRIAKRIRTWFMVSWLYCTGNRMNELAYFQGVKW